MDRCHDDVRNPVLGVERGDGGAERSVGINLDSGQESDCNEDRLSACGVSGSGSGREATC